MLFAPCCAKCSEFISGRVLRALGASWHPTCLTCHHCDQPVADQGFTKVGQVVTREARWSPGGPGHQSGPGGHQVTKEVTKVVLCWQPSLG